MPESDSEDEEREEGDVILIDFLLSLVPLQSSAVSSLRSTADHTLESDDRG